MMIDDERLSILYTRHQISVQPTVRKKESLYTLLVNENCIRNYQNYTMPTGENG